MSLRRPVRAWNRLVDSADDAPLWAEVLGVLFAPALFVRGAIHVWVALLADVDPRLAPGHDVTAQSPIRGLRESRHDDAIARLGVFGAGVFAVVAWSPTFAVAIWPAPVAAWVVAQTGVLLAEPLLFGLTKLRRD